MQKSATSKVKRNLERLGITFAVEEAELPRPVPHEKVFGVSYGHFRTEGVPSYLEGVIHEGSDEITVPDYLRDLISESQTIPGPEPIPAHLRDMISAGPLAKKQRAAKK